MRAQVRTVQLPCMIFPGMFSGEYQFEIRPPDQDPIYCFATSSSAVFTTVSVLPNGVPGFLKAQVVQDLGSRMIVDLPGHTASRGPRVSVPKGFVSKN